MVADEFFDLRSRLGAALFSLGRVADLAGLKPSRAPLVKSLVEGLRDPFVFVVAGEVNAGKSTLLNALFGEEFCPASVLPETQRIHYFRYGKTPQRTAVSAECEEIELPHAFLRDFHIVDTPGVNSTESGHELITGNFIPRADAVLYCFPSTNPWSGAAWEFLERIHRDWLKKTVLVLQQSDLRTSEEVAAISEHMRGLARQRLGEELPVIAVSARLGLLARTSGLDKSRLMAASAFPALEQHLTAMVTRGISRTGKLVSACAAGQGLLAEVQSNMAHGSAQLRELTTLRAGAGEALTAAREQVAEQAVAEAQTLRAACDALTSESLSRSLAERRRFPALLWSRDPTAETVESRLLPPLMTAVRALSARVDGSVEKHLRELWTTPGQAVHAAMEGRMERTDEPPWPPPRDGLTSALENTACEAITQSGLAAFWSGRLTRRARLLRGLIFVSVLVLGAVAATCFQGSLTFPAAGWALIFPAAAAWTGWLTLRRETRETADLATPLLTDTGRRLEQSAQSLMLDHNRRRLDDFLPVLEPLDRLIQRREQATGSLEEEAGQLAATLHSLAKSLRSGGGDAPPGAMPL